MENETQTKVVRIPPEAYDIIAAHSMYFRESFGSILLRLLTQAGYASDEKTKKYVIWAKNNRDSKGELK